MKKLFVVIILCGVAAYGWYSLALRPVDASSTARIKTTIESGWSTTKIADHLQERGLIRSPLAFRLHLKAIGKDGSLQAGVYLLQPSFSADQIISTLQTGRAEEMIVTIPEGYTVQDIDNLLTEMGLISKGDAIECANTCDFASYDFLPTDTATLAHRGGKLEGYTYPDTYYVPANDFVVKFFFERMLNAFRKNVVEQYGDEIAASGRDLHEFITMTSLVEEETRTQEESPIVAAILWKRYDEGWGLGVDAAVRYIVNKPSADITHGDLNTNSPYNLRKFRGLPPGPIASVGERSVLATLRPESTKYWYYLHDKTGQIHYAETNEQHNMNRYNYLGSGAE